MGYRGGLLGFVQISSRSFKIADGAQGDLSRDGRSWRRRAPVRLFDFTTDDLSDAGFVRTNEISVVRMHLEIGRQADDGKMAEFVSLCRGQLRKRACSLCAKKTKNQLHAHTHTRINEGGKYSRVKCCIHSSVLTPNSGTFCFIKAKRGCFFRQSGVWRDSASSKRWLLISASSGDSAQPPRRQR